MKISAIDVSAIVNIMLMLWSATPLVPVVVVLEFLASEPAELEEEAGVEVPEEVEVESAPAILKIFASGESAGSFSIAAHK